jgi:hypothetical protein
MAPRAAIFYPSRRQIFSSKETPPGGQAGSRSLRKAGVAALPLAKRATARRTAQAPAFASTRQPPPTAPKRVGRALLGAVDVTEITGERSTGALA